MWRRKLRGKNKKGKIKYGILTAAAAAVVWLFMPFHTIKGSGEEIYVGGMPDSWPFEFYDSKKLLIREYCLRYWIPPPDRRTWKYDM